MNTSSLSIVISERAHQSPDKIALVDGDLRVSYFQLNSKVRCIAKHLSQFINQEARIVLHLPNSSELVYSYLACFLAGMVAVPISIKSKTMELDHVLQNAEAVCLITHESLIGEIKHINFNNTTLKKIFVVGDQQILTSPFSPFQQLFEDKQPDSLLFPDLDRLAAIFYTSGSTGVPKGVMHSHASLSAMADNIADCVNLTEDDIFLVTEAITNASGCSHAMSALYYGATVAIGSEMGDVEQLIKSIHQYHPTILSIMGKLNFDIIADAHINTNDFSGVRVNFTGGDKITKKLLIDFKQKTHVHLQQGYGMSEALCITVNKSERLDKLGAIGKPTKDLQIRLLDNSGNPVLDGEPGIIWVSGPNVMTGYWRNKELTNETLQDNWLYTGDMAYKDEDGYFWFYGRVKQLIIRQGDNISPFEVEEAIMQHPAVMIAGVTGKPDSLEGEVPVIFVVLKNDQQVSGAELIKFLSTRLEDYKIPVEIYIVSSLPLTKSNKIDRHRLKDLVVTMASSSKP